MSNVIQHGTDHADSPGDRARRTLSRLLRLGGIPAATLVVVILLSSGFASAATPSGPTAVFAASPPVAVSSGTGASSQLSAHGALSSVAHSPSVVPTTSPTTPKPLNPVPLLPPSTGKGTFFTTVAQPNPNAVSVPGYYTTYTYNGTMEPSLNLTSTGLMAVAYTAYTDDSPCSSMTGNATTEVGFSVSTDLGGNWSTPVYLGNPVCTGYDANFSSAMQPSLTSLANGTLVLAYDEYNVSNTTNVWPNDYYKAGPNTWCGSITYDRIVVTESYDNGTTWATPTVMSSVTNDSAGCPNSGFPDVQPWVTAYGDTVYLTWMTYTLIGHYSICPYYPVYGAGTPSAQVQFAHSTNGGSTWSSTSQLSDFSGSFPYGCYTGSGYVYSTSMSINPTELVLPNGELVLAYVSALSDDCQPSYYPCGDMVVAQSTTNGTSWSYSFPHNNTGLMYSECCSYMDSFWSPMPSLAYSKTTGQLFLGYAEGQYGLWCYDYGYGTYCYNSNNLNVVVQNTSDLGANWSEEHMIAPQLVNNESATGSPASPLFYPSLAVDSKGILHVQASYINDSICYTSPASFCNGHQEIYVNSSDNGTTFSTPVLVYYLTGSFLYYGPYQDNEYAGQYSTMIAAGNEVYLAWTTEQCPNFINGTFCYWGGATSGYSEVMVSQMYRGPGVTLTFQETGLPSGQTWEAFVMGQPRAGSAPTSLQVSGVPPNSPIAFYSPWVNRTWGIAYSNTVFPTSPNSFKAGSTIYVNYTELVKLTIETVPYLSYYSWLYGYVNYAMSPTPGSSWVTVGTSQSITLTPTTASYCYPCTNLTFLSWTGSGSGNVTTLSPNITVTANGPVNETASFRLNGWCFYSYYTASNVCLNNTYYPMDFVESGLPANVAWGVTITTSNGTSYFNSTSGTLNGFLIPDDLVSFDVWTVPDPTSGEVWVPTTDVQSPVTEPQAALIHVKFTEEAASAATFTAHVFEDGLPAGTPWSVEVNGVAYGVQGDNASFQLTGGTNYTLNGSAVYLETGYGYYASKIVQSDYVMNATNLTYSAQGTFLLNGSSLLTIEYSPLYLVTTAASVGGVVSPATGWVTEGTLVTLNATADPGYHFVSWTGSGSGATTVAQAGQWNATCTPRGPVTEFATFRPNLPATWNLTLVAVGLPSGTDFTVSIGGLSVSGSGNLTVGEITNGSYAISVPYVYLNSTDTTRFVPTSVVSSLTFSSSGLLEITANGTLTMTFSTQYLVQIVATPAVGGTVSPVAGQYWTDAGTQVPLSASPAAGYYFAGWNASSSNGVTTTDESATLTAAGPVVETAQFNLRPILPPATYWVTVNEQGLPSGVSWNISFGTTGASGTNATLTLNGLNGSYVVTIPYIYTSPGVRFAPNVTSANIEVSGNTTNIVQVQFGPQYLVTVGNSPGGNVTPSSEWVNQGTSVTFTATPGTGYAFANWSGSGSQAFTGTTASFQVTVTGPITEQATFVPVYKQTTTTQSGTEGLPIALGLLVALLVVGLVVGLLVGRRRRGGAGPAPLAPAETAPEGGATYAEPPAED